MIGFEQPPVYLVPTDSAVYVDAVADQFGLGTSVLDTAAWAFPGRHTVALRPVEGLGVLMYLAPVPASEQVA